MTIGKSLAWPPGNADTGDRAREVDNRTVAVTGRPRDRLIADVLLAQDLYRPVDVGGAHFRHRALDRDAGQFAELDLRINLEYGGELEVILGRGLLRLDSRIAGHAQVLLANGVVEARLDGVRDHVGPHLRAVLLRHHLQWNLARTKTCDLDRLRKARQPLVDFAVDLLQRHGHIKPALELAQRFQCRLHTR